MNTKSDWIQPNGHKYPEDVVLLWFTAQWCGPCKQLVPIVESLENANAESMRVVKMDVGEEEALAQQFGVRAVPTLILLDRNKRLDTHVGLTSFNQLNNWVSNYIN